MVWTGNGLNWNTRGLKMQCICKWSSKFFFLYKRKKMERVLLDGGFDKENNSLHNRFMELWATKVLSNKSGFMKVSATVAWFFFFYVGIVLEVDVSYLLLYYIIKAFNSPNNDGEYNNNVVSLCKIYLWSLYSLACHLKCKNKKQKQNNIRVIGR